MPQGSVLGPLLFINNVVQQISNCSKFFANDIALYYRTIYTQSDYICNPTLIQSAVSSCLTYLSLNASKYCCLFLSCKRFFSIRLPSLTLGDTPLTKVSRYKYLGVLITSKLMWSSHVTNICNKTRRLVGLLYRNFYNFSSPLQTQCYVCTPPS